MIKEVVIGDNVSIEICENEWIATKVLDIRDDVLIVNKLKHPDSKKRMSKNKRYNAVATQKKNFLEFEVKYISDEMLDDLQVSSIELVSEVMIYQRRNNFRLSTNLEFNIDVLDDNNNIAEKIKGTTIDLSEFGALVCVNTRIETDSRVRCEFKINEYNVSREGIVLRWYQKENIKDRYFTAINFLDEDETNLKHIRRFLFETQRKQIKRTKEE